MSLRAAAQQALEALVLWATGRDIDAVALNDLIFRLEAALAEPVKAWHFIDCEGECLACLIEREVKATYGNQGLAHLRRHVGGNNESA